MRLQLELRQRIEAVLRLRHAQRIRQVVFAAGRRKPAALAGATIFLVALIAGGQASALTLDEAREQCRQTVGRPIVQACMRGGGGDLEACRATAHPKVHACVVAAMNAANGRANVALPVPSAAARSDERAAAQEPSPNPSPAPSYVPPPRTITDVTAILDSEKPDSEQIKQWKAAADAKPPSNGSREALARFYYARGNARDQLGRLKDAIADANAAVEAARSSGNAHLLGRVEQFAGLEYSFAGEPKSALAVFSRQIREVDVPGAKGYQFNSNRQITHIYLQMGDFPQADAFVRRNSALIVEARTSGLPGWRSHYPILGQSWESEVEVQRAMVFEARGQFREAEASYRTAELRTRAGIRGVLSLPDPPPERQILQKADMLVLSQGRMKARQGRLAEAEADARRALLARLKDQGKYHPRTPFFILGLADILIEQGRYDEAEKLIRAAIEINRVVGVADDSQNSARMLADLAGVLNLQRKAEAAVAVYAELDRAIANWEPQRRQAFELNGSRVYSLYATGQIDAGVAAAQALVKREVTRVGESHLFTATARGVLAIGYALADRDQEAGREFKTAIPVLMAAARESVEDDDTTVIAARRERLQNVVEAYIRLLAKHKDDAGSDAISETFALAEAIRGRSVQRAITSASARMAASDPAIAELLRREQDLGKEVGAQLGLLNNVLSLAPDQRDAATVRQLEGEIAALRTQHDKVRQEIGRKVPSYGELVEPKPPTPQEVKASLRPGETLVSFYFGRQQGYVWAIAKDGPATVAVIPASFADIARKVDAVRATLEPRDDVLPDFDLAAAYELYVLLLQPVEPVWKSAKSIIVVTNGALGELPISLLPTARARIDVGAKPQFVGYRDVPWLVRTHPVTTVPSASALLTLRRLPPGSPQRESLIGFGDPFFNQQQANDAGQEAPIRVAAADPTTTSSTKTETRGLALRGRVAPNTRGLDTASLETLPRLPDTALELKAMADALGAEPTKSLYLGKAANEQTVKTLDLSRYRIVAFSTHGLLPGDLDGLTQPALALSAPSVAGVEGDGLLTMDEVLALKLDADWVVLSACNTAAGAGIGSEAASGLGRAFFYAGSRALLVTNWSVHSESARDLISDLFRRQHADAQLSRNEALRQAMLALLDAGEGNAEDGTPISYAHPWFWAPYSIIGDGG